MTTKTKSDALKAPYEFESPEAYLAYAEDVRKAWDVVCTPEAVRCSLEIEGIHVDPKVHEELCDLWDNYPEFREAIQALIKEGKKHNLPAPANSWAEKGEAP